MEIQLMEMFLTAFFILLVSENPNVGFVHENIKILWMPEKYILDLDPRYK